MKGRIEASSTKSFTPITLGATEVANILSIPQTQQYWKSKARFLILRSCGITCSTPILPPVWGICLLISKRCKHQYQLNRPENTATPG